MKKYLKPGTYYVKAEYRADIEVEEGQQITEMQLVDMAVGDPSCELINWEVL